VLAVGDRLVSWGDDGAILFWSLDGASLAGGAVDAHSGRVGGLLPVSDQLVSWGDDGAIRFWSLDGIPVHIMVVPGGAFSGLWYLPPDRLIAAGSALWSYKLPIR
jgi:WD40 repeat protein